LGDPRGDVADVELALLGGEAGVEDDLKEQVAELLAERLPRAAVGDAVHLVEDLVTLLDEVGPQRADVLLLVPGAAGTQAGHDFDEALEGFSVLSHAGARRLITYADRKSVV